MLNTGDIVLLSLPNEEKTKTGLVIGISDTSDSLNIAYLTTQIDKYNANKFTEPISSSDLETGFLKKDSIILVDRIMTAPPGLCEKIASLKKDKLNKILRIFSHYAAYSYFKSTFRERRPGDYIPPSGKVLDERELFNMIDASLDMWLTAGRFHEDFENKFAEFLGVKHTLAVNSGSSANLLALSALTSDRLGNKRLGKGDEVITVAAAFPTTIAPIVQNGLVPVFVDVEPGTYNIDPAQIENAVSEKTKAIFIAHTLGNPFNLDKVLEIREKYGLFLIEDNCDALGSKYGLASDAASPNQRYTGTYGDISTFSFYPAHQITMGEGGAVTTNDSRLNKIMLSMRDWGRDCWCPTGKDNTCAQRFSQQHGGLPAGYDHKYVYSHLGYNLKITDWQAAIGLIQLQKLPLFLEKRKENFRLLYEGLKPFEEYLILPRTTGNSDPAWFGFPVTVKENTGFNRITLIKFLEDHKIGTRQLFTGNILRQPVFLNNEIKMRIGDSKVLLSNRLTEDDYKIIPNTDIIMNSTFWIGIWPGLTRETMEYIIQTIREFIVSQG